MAVNRNIEHQGIAKGLTATLAVGRKRGPKPQGTRVGTLEDWREGSMKSGSVVGRRGNALRDGR